MWNAAAEVGFGLILAHLWRVCSTGAASCKQTQVLGMGLRTRKTLWEEQRRPRQKESEMGREGGRERERQTDRQKEREREGGRHGSVLLAGLEAARTVLIPTSLKLWPNQAWNQEQRDSRDWRELDSHCLNPGGVCTRVCVCEWVSVHVCTKQLRCCTCLF